MLRCLPFYYRAVRAAVPRARQRWKLAAYAEIIRLASSVNFCCCVPTFFPETFSKYPSREHKELNPQPADRMDFSSSRPFHHQAHAVRFSRTRNDRGSFLLISAGR